MIKIFANIIKKFILSLILLFVFNTFLSSFNIMVPINVITIILVSLFDVPAIVGLTLFYMLMF